MISTETGKPLVQAEREWALSIDQFRWYAEEARRIYGRVIESRVPKGRLEVTKEAIGIVGAFTAWNFPAALPSAQNRSGHRRGLFRHLAALLSDPWRRNDYSKLHSYRRSTRWGRKPSDWFDHEYL